MDIPARFPGLRVATMLLIAGAIIWIALEGNLTRVLLLASATTLIVTAHVLQWLFGGRLLAPVRWLVHLALAGLVAGAAIPVLTLLLMVLKTGLHGHGPEFTAADFIWVSNNVFAWSGGGLLGGTGLGLITLALRRR
ncbi:MAG: hypothetical protein RRC07_11720 [Anaerolineae bacterium]|nr:hypothetical protein [Anaerolineae bacterium]